MNKDHLKIHKEPSLNAGFYTRYLVNKYYDYNITHYFETLKDAQEFIDYSKFLDQHFKKQENV